MYSIKTLDPHLSTSLCEASKFGFKGRVNFSNTFVNSLWLEELLLNGKAFTTKFIAVSRSTMHQCDPSRIIKPHHLDYGYSGGY